MKFSIVKTIFFKELLDTLRDKRTLIAMIGIPIILYPAVFIVAAEVAVIQRSKVTQSVSRIALEGPGSDVLRQWFQAEETLEIANPDSPDAALSAGEIDAIVITEGRLDTLSDGADSGSLSVKYDATEAPSRQAADRVEDSLEAKDEEILRIRLQREGLSEAFVHPLDVRLDNVAPPEKTTGSMLGVILPLILVTMLGVGAFYPAIDLTAGEKERGTFETLLSTPVTKIEIIAGKFCAVFLLAIVTGLLNLGSMLATLLFQIIQLAELRPDSGPAFGAIDIPPQSIFALIIVIIPLALFISAAMMSVALLARSFKDAQNYVSPFFVLIILPATFAAIPEAEFSSATQFIPITNAALLFRDILIGKASAEAVFTVMICTVVYALLALRIGVWLFQREEVILSEEGGIPLTWRRAEIVPRSVPTPGLALGIFAVVMLLIFYIGSYLQARDVRSGLLVTEYVLILAVVLAALAFCKVNLRESLNVHAPRWLGLLGTAVVMLAWLPLIVEIGVWLNRLLPLPDEFRLFSEQLFAGPDTLAHYLWMLFLIAITPAICEEVLFRGTILSSLKGRLPGWAIILVVGLLFGLFHLSLYRFVSTGLTGMLLTYIALRTGSIFPAMLGHAILNGCTVSVETGNAPQAIVDYLAAEELERTGLPLWMLGLSVLVLLLGIGLIELGRGRNARRRSPGENLPVEERV